MANLLQQYRETFPEFREMNDAQLTDALYEKYAGKDSKTDKADFSLMLRGRGPRISPFAAGIEGLKGAAETVIARGAQALGAEETAKEYLGRAEERQQDVAERYQPETRGYEDIDSAYKLGRFLYERFGESAPQMLLQVGGGIGGLALRGAAGAVGLAAARGLSPAAAAAAGSTAAGAGAFTGYNIQRQMEEGTPFEQTSLAAAGGAALAQSALDTLSLATLFKGFPGLSPSQISSRVAAAAVRSVESGATEFLTEGGQQALEILQANPTKFFEFGPEVQKEIFSAAVTGGILGGALGGAAGAITFRKPRAPGEPEPTTQQVPTPGGEPPAGGEPAGGEPPPAPAAGVEPGAAVAGVEPTGTEPVQVPAGTEPVAGVEPVTAPPPTVQGPEPLAPAPKIAAPPEPAAAPAPAPAPEPVAAPAPAPITAAPKPEPAPAPAPTKVQGPQIFTVPNPPSLPKNLQLGKWTYTYGNQGKFTLNFSSDLEKALFQTSKKTQKPKDALYRNWLKAQGLSDGDIDTLGNAFRSQLSSFVANALKTGPNIGTLTVPRFDPGSFGLGAPSPAPKPAAPTTPAVPTSPAAPAPTQALGQNEPMAFGTGAEPGVTAGAIPFPEQQTKRSRVDVNLGYNTPGYQYRTQAPGQATSLITVTKDHNDRLEATLPGAMNVLREIHARMFPGMELKLQVNSGLMNIAGKDLPRGSSFVISPKQVEIEINPDVLAVEFGTGPERQTKMLHTMFHELSHAVEAVYLVNAPKSVLEALIKQYEKARNPSAANRAAIAFALSRHKDASDPSFLPDLLSYLGISADKYKKYVASASKKYPGELFLGKGLRTSQITGDYYRSFTEFTAEKVAEWTIKEAKGLVPKTTFEKGIKAIYDRLRKLYNTVAKALGISPRKGAFEAYMQEVYGKRAEVSAVPGVAGNVTGKGVINYVQSGDTQGRPTLAAIKKAMAQSGGSELPATPPAPPPTSRMEERPTVLREEAAPVDLQSARDRIFAAQGEQKGRFRQFVDRVQQLYKDGGWQSLADAFSREVVDKYIYLKRLDDRFVAAMKAAGNKIASAYDQRMALAARLSSHASMLDRENVLAKVNTLLFKGGVPVYKTTDPNNPLDGVIKVEGEGKGLSFLLDLQKAGKLRNWAEYAVARRVLNSYQQKGLEFQITPAEAQAIVDLHSADPEIVNAYNQYQELNKALIKLNVDAGRLSQKQADDLLQFNDYYPFYRDVDAAGRYTGPTNSKGLLSPSRIRQAKGGTELLQEDPIDVILKNTQFWIASAQKNIAARKIYNMSEFLGEGRQLSFSKQEQDAMLNAMFNGDEAEMRKYMQREKMLRPGEVEGSYFVDGVERRIALSNPDVAEALLVVDGPVPDLFKGIFGTFTTGYRELVTRSPEYILSNVIRDSVSQWVTSGVPFNPLRAMRNVIDFMRQKENNEKVLALMQYGVIGGYKAIPELDDATKLLNPNFNPIKGGVYVPKSGKALSDIISKVWNNLGELSDASDAASRMEIYDRVLKETGDEYEAAFRAQEAMNYRKQGRNSLLKYLTVMVPFINGRIQGLDVTARAFGPKAIAYTAAKGSILFGVAMGLQAMFGDDEEYKQLPEYVRYGSLPIPLKALGLGDNGFLAIPKPFEMGFVFQTVPEVIYQAMLGNVENRSIVRVLGEQLASTFGLSLTPQIISPIVETFVQNRSNLTGLPIVTEAMKNLPKELQYTSATSDIVKDVASLTGISPVQAEALIKGYGGQIGTSIFGIVDGLYRAASGRGVDKDWTQYPVVQKFLKTEANTNAQGVADVYRLSAEIQGLTTALNTFVAQGSADKARDLIEKNQGLFAMKSSISGLRTELNNLSRQERMIRNNDNIDQASKEAQIEAIREARRQIGKTMTDSIKYTQK